MEAFDATRVRTLSGRDVCPPTGRLENWAVQVDVHVRELLETNNSIDSTCLSNAAGILNFPNFGSKVSSTRPGILPISKIAFNDQDSTRVRLINHRDTKG